MVFKGVWGTANHILPPKVAFLFSGHGSQYPKMGWELYETQPVFRQAINECNEILGYYIDTSLDEVLYRDSDKFFKIWDAQYLFPALFSVEYALFKLWQSFGVQPSGVAGISVGEFAAACAAGVFSLEDGLKLVATYGRLCDRLQQNACRTVGIIGATEEQVAAAVQLYEAEVEIVFYAGIKTAIAGNTESVEAVIYQLKAANLTVITKELPLLNRGLHTQRVEPIIADFEQVARAITYSSPQIEFISIATGKLVTAEVATPEYWLNNLRQPSRLSALIKTATDRGYEIFVECGPGEIALKGAIACLASLSEKEKEVWLPSLLQKSSDCQTLQNSLKELQTCGVRVSWEHFYLNCSSRVSVDSMPKLEDFGELLQETDELFLPNPRKLLRLLEEALEGDRLELLIAHIQSEVAKIIKISQLPPADLNFVEMGIESLEAIELMNLLRLNLGFSLPLTVLVHFPNISVLSKHILERQWQSKPALPDWKFNGNNDATLTSSDRQFLKSEITAFSDRDLTALVSRYMQVHIGESKAKN